MVVVLTAGLFLAPAALGDTYKIKTTSGNRWNPDFQHIHKGEKIRWKNPASHQKTHVVKSYGGNWNKNVTLQSGEGTAKTFKRTGAFKYRCTIHSVLAGGECNGMCGLIHVVN
jgi:plastocyanin